MSEKDLKNIEEYWHVELHHGDGEVEIKKYERSLSIDDVVAQSSFQAKDSGVTRVFVYALAARFNARALVN